MSKRVKVSDLEVTERDRLLLIYRELQDPPYWSNEKPKLPLLHVCKRDGKKPGKRSMFSSSPSTYNITECNRPMTYPSVMHEKELGFDSYRLCLRCGTQKDFENVLAKYHKSVAESNRSYHQQMQQREAQHKLERKELAERINDFSCEFFENFPAVGVGSNGLPYALKVEYNGHLYEIKEVEK